MQEEIMSGASNYAERNARKLPFARLALAGLAGAGTVAFLLACKSTTKEM